MLSLGGCGTVSSKPLSTVAYVDISKFMGDWYVIANIPTFVEKGANNAIESYSWNLVEDRIDVDFRYNADSPKGPIKRYPQKAWIYDKKTNAEWRVQPWWPFKFSYLVIDLAPDYSYTVIGVPSRNYVWIMARKPQIEPEIYSRIVSKLKSSGYEVSRIQKVPQIW